MYMYTWYKYSTGDIRGMYIRGNRTDVGGALVKGRSPPPVGPEAAVWILSLFPKIDIPELFAVHVAALGDPHLSNILSSSWASPDP